MAKDLQPDFAACPVNYVDAFYCCSYGNGSKTLFTKYQLPPSEDQLAFASYYRDGWHHPMRQINSPSAMYTPSTPSFRYDASHHAQLCRLLLISSANSSQFQEILQCGDQNTTMLQHSQDFNVFMSFQANPRNNNASFPIGAVCQEIDASQTKSCKAKGVYALPKNPVHIYFQTYLELPLVVVYTVFGTFLGSLLVWFALNKRRAAQLLNSTTKEHSSTSPSTSKAKHLLSSDHSFAPPMTPLGGAGDGGGSGGGGGNMAAVDVRESSMYSLATGDHYQHHQDHQQDHQLHQFGFNDSRMGTLQFYICVVLTMALNALLIVIICDYYDDFYPTRLFDRKNGLITAFIACWSFLALWLLTIVQCQKQIRNFFRVPAPLNECEFVQLVLLERSKVLLRDSSGISGFVERLEQRFLLAPTSGGFQRYDETLRVQKTTTMGDGHNNNNNNNNNTEALRFVDFQHVRYVYDHASRRFVPGRIRMPTTHSGIRLDASHGLCQTDSDWRLELVGPNALQVEMPTWTQSLVAECFTFFYIYQIMCYYVWYYFNYWRMAIVMTSVIGVTGLVNIVTKRRMQSSVVAMVQYDSVCQVCRDKKWTSINTKLLVPGDLIRVDRNWVLPCDLVVVKGSVVCDESMLTGESMPVQKRALVALEENIVYDAEGDSKKHTLFAGTRVLGDETANDDEVLAVVMQTGAFTSKGRLVHSILYPVPMRFKYNQHLKVLIAVLFVVGAVAIGVSLYILISDGRLTNKRYSFIYVLAMLIGIVSPLLPVVVTVGQVQAARRLERKGIFSLNAQRITLGGKTRVFCFDKTGTLTKKGLDFYGVQPIVRQDHVQGYEAILAPVTTDLASSSSVNDNLRLALAVCHSLGTFENRLVGNEVEIKMFEASQWNLVNGDANVTSPDSQTQVDYVKRFAFDHARRSMSVVVREHQSGALHVFCKGSFEEILRKVPDKSGVPANFAETANALAKQGFYVLAMAHRQLVMDASMAPSEVDKLVRDRSGIEQDLTLLGLLLFRNDLKEDTSDAIKQLKDADTRVVMVTGDSALCGCFVAKECGMISPVSRVLLGDMVPTSTHGLKQLVWTDIDSNECFSLDQIKARCQSQQQEEVELAVTGDAFHYLKSISEMNHLLFDVRVFSRMNPQDKVQCIEAFMDQGVVTGMCGDGGNDCGALRVAHVGLALSGTDNSSTTLGEASVVAPFTSRNASVLSVIDLCREGRASLATSFASVKFLVMHGLTMTTMRLAQYINVVIISEWCYNYCNGFVLVGLSYVLTLGKPLPRLGKQRPTSSLLGPTTLASLLGQEAINVVFLLVCLWFLKSRVWYCPFSPDSIDMSKWWLMGDNPVATCLFFVTAFQQQTAALVFGFGSQFRQPVYKNVGFVLFYGLLMLAELYLLLGGPDAFTDLFRIASGPNVVGLPEIPLPFDFRVQYLLLLVVNLICVACFEYLVVLGPIRAALRRKYHRDVFRLRL